MMKIFSEYLHFSFNNGQEVFYSLVFSIVLYLFKFNGFDFCLLLFSVLPEFLLSEIASWSSNICQIRQLFGQKSRKNHQFLASFCGKVKMTPYTQVLLRFYASINIFQNFQNNLLTEH